MTGGEGAGSGKRRGKQNVPGGNSPGFCASLSSEESEESSSSLLESSTMVSGTVARGATATFACAVCLPFPRALLGLRSGPARAADLGREGRPCVEAADGCAREPVRGGDAAAADLRACLAAEDSLGTPLDAGTGRGGPHDLLRDFEGEPGELSIHSAAAAACAASNASSSASASASASAFACASAFALWVSTHSDHQHILSMRCQRSQRWMHYVLISSGSWRGTSDMRTSFSSGNQGTKATNAGVKLCICHALSLKLQNRARIQALDRKDEG